MRVVLLLLLMLGLLLLREVAELSQALLLLLRLLIWLLLRLALCTTLLIRLVSGVEVVVIHAGDGPWAEDAEVGNGRRRWWRRLSGCGVVLVP